MTKIQTKPELFDAVQARFGGRDINFKIARDDLVGLEAYAGDSAYRLFKVITAGQWTVAQITSVLRFATMSAKQLTHYKAAAAMPLTGLVPSRFAKPTFVDAVLSTQPPAQYASLAMAILGGALFGIEAADAVFTDGTPDAV